MNIAIYSDGAKLCKFFYSNNGEALSDYLPIKYLYSENGSFELSLPDHIPEQATHISAAAYDGEMRIVHEETVALDKRKTAVSEKPAARTAVISDLHTIQKGKSKRLLYEAFEGVKEQKADFVISAGDNTNGCQQGEFDILNASVTNHLGAIPFYAALGNHDYFSNHQEVFPCKEAREDFLRRIKQNGDITAAFDFGTYAARVGGIHVIFLDCIRDSRHFLFDDETEKWLRAELSKSQGERVRIVVNHLPLAGRALGSYKAKAYLSGDSRLQRVIDDCGQIVYISGHTHNRLDSDFPSAEQDENGNIYLNAGSIGNTQPCIKDTKNLKKRKDSLPKEHLMYHEINNYFKMASMGAFLELYEDRIAVKGYDFSQKKFIPRCSFMFDIRQ